MNDFGIGFYKKNWESINSGLIAFNDHLKCWQKDQENSQELFFTEFNVFLQKETQQIIQRIKQQESYCLKDKKLNKPQESSFVLDKGSNNTIQNSDQILQESSSISEQIATNQQFQTNNDAKEESSQQINYSAFDIN